MPTEDGHRAGGGAQLAAALIGSVMTVGLIGAAAGVVLRRRRGSNIPDEAVPEVAAGAVSEI